jgi:hypothetical protein
MRIVNQLLIFGCGDAAGKYGRSDLGPGAVLRMAHMPRGAIPRASAIAAMKATSAAVLASTIIVAGCASGPGQLLFESPKIVEYLDGQYQRLASCTYKQLGRYDNQLQTTDLRERRAVKITSAQWELTFIDEDGGRQTRLEVTSVTGTFPSEHMLALARACAA